MLRRGGGVVEIIAGVKSGNVLRLAGRARDRLDRRCMLILDRGLRYFRIGRGTVSMLSSMSLVSLSLYNGCKDDGD